MAQWFGGNQIDPLGYALGQGFGQGLQGLVTSSLWNRDMQALQQYLQGPQGYQGLGGMFPTKQQQMPQFLHPMFQQLIPQMMMQPEISPSQQISQKKLDEINRLQAKVDAGKASQGEKSMLEKMLAGQPMVQIGLGQPAAAAERKEIAETRASVDSLNHLKTLYDSAKTRTGPIAGRIDPIIGLFGWTTDEQEDFMAATSAFRNKIIEEITGAQMSEVEAKRILKQVPQETDPPRRWEAKWRQSKINLEMLQRRRMEILQQSGLRVPMGEIPVDIRNMTDEELKRLAGVE